MALKKTMTVDELRDRNEASQAAAAAERPTPPPPSTNTEPQQKG
ncbi:hypothetical protein [Streptomyces sp. NPDC006274]|jgi:hypothetical protein